MAWVMWVTGLGRSVVQKHRVEALLLLLLLFLRLLFCLCVTQDEVVIYPAQVIDPDMYKLSVQLFRHDRDRRPSTTQQPPVVTLPTTAVH